MKKTRTDFCKTTFDSVKDAVVSLNTYVTAAHYALCGNIEDGYSSEHEVVESTDVATRQLSVYHKEIKNTVKEPPFFMRENLSSVILFLLGIASIITGGVLSLSPVLFGIIVKRAVYIMPFMVGFTLSIIGLRGFEFYYIGENSIWEKKLNKIRAHNATAFDALDTLEKDIKSLKETAKLIYMSNVIEKMYREHCGNIELIYEPQDEILRVVANGSEYRRNDLVKSSLDGEEQVFVLKAEDTDKIFKDDVLDFSWLDKKAKVELLTVKDDVSLVEGEKLPFTLKLEIAKDLIQEDK